MQQFRASIVTNNRVADGYFRLLFHWPRNLIAPVPGQFVTIRSGSGTDPLLRRPFALSSFDVRQWVASIVYERRGKATTALSALHAGDVLDVLGPLGNHFPYVEPGNLPILIGGGIGFGPIYFLGISQMLEDIDQKVIFGARTAGLIPKVPYPKQSDGQSVFSFCTDDGSSGYQGTVIDFLSSLDNALFERAALYACGPEAMLKACARFAVKKKVQCWVSLEQIMGCGVGACMGCVVKTKSGYSRVCTEGPVFDAGEIVWK